MSDLDKLVYFHPSFSMLVYSSPTGFFRSSRGLRQGNPLSPYLFVQGMEALFILIDKAAFGEFIYGHSLRESNGSEEMTSHLLYADDTMSFL